MPKIVRDDRARQGPPGRPVLAVLLGALFLCAVSIGGYMIWVGMTSPDDPSQAASRKAITGSPTGTSGSGSSATEPSSTGTTNR